MNHSATSGTHYTIFPLKNPVRYPFAAKKAACPAGQAAHLSEKVLAIWEIAQKEMVGVTANRAQQFAGLLGRESFTINWTAFSRSIHPLRGFIELFLRFFIIEIYAALDCDQRTLSFGILPTFEKVGLKLLICLFCTVLLH